MELLAFAFAIFFALAVGQAQKEIKLERAENLECMDSKTYQGDHSFLYSEEQVCTTRKQILQRSDDY